MAGFCEMKSPALLNTPLAERSMFSSLTQNVSWKKHILHRKSFIHLIPRNEVNCVKVFLS